MKKVFREIFQKSESRLPIGAEVVTTRGIPNPESCPPISLARELIGDDRIAWVSITDNPGGNPMRSRRQRLYLDDCLHRLKYFDELKTFENAPVIVYDAALKGTSVWANLYLNRDHSADESQMGNL